MRYLKDLCGILRIYAVFKGFIRYFRGLTSIYQGSVLDLLNKRAPRFQVPDDNSVISEAGK